MAQETTALKASYSGLSQNPEPYSTTLLDAVNEPMFLPTPREQSLSANIITRVKNAYDGDDKEEDELQHVAVEKPSESGNLFNLKKSGDRFKALDGEKKEERREESVIKSLGKNSMIDKSDVILSSVEKGEFESRNVPKPVERPERAADKDKGPMKKEQDREESAVKSIAEIPAHIALDSGNNFVSIDESDRCVKEIEVEKLMQNNIQELKEMAKETADQEKVVETVNSDDTYMSGEEPGKPPIRQELGGKVDQIKGEIEKEIQEAKVLVKEQELDEAAAESVETESKEIDDGSEFEEMSDRASNMMTEEAARILNEGNREAGREETVVEFRQMGSDPSLEFVKGSDTLNKDKLDKESDLSISLDSSSEKVMVEFRDWMPVLGEKLHIMPLYPSWSIHCLGKYSSYSHSTGEYFCRLHCRLPQEVETIIMLLGFGQLRNDK